MSIDLAFLFSEPQIFYDIEGTPIPLERLDLDFEQSLLFESLNEANKSINVRIEAATTRNLRTLVTRGCKGIHYSGHGDESCLAFEDGKGAIHAIDPVVLNTLFQAGGTRDVEFVVVNSCHSQLAGEAFVSACVPHVIATKIVSKGYGIADEAAIAFTHQFYLALLSGKSIQESFEIGKESVATDPSIDEAKLESDKFLLLPLDKPHDHIPFPDVPDGKWNDFSKTLSPINFAAVMGFTGRQIELAEIIRQFSSTTLITIKGVPGIGKTALGKSAAFYLHKRHFFSRGIFFFDLHGIKSVKGLMSAILNHLDLRFSSENEFFLILRNLELLIILDNAESLLNEDRVGFINFVQRVLTSSNKLKFLVTSRQPLEIPNEKIVELHQLSSADAVRLFITRAPRPIKPSDVDAADEEDVFKALQNHPALIFMSGHPHVIELLAPHLQFRSLSEIYDDIVELKEKALKNRGMSEDQLTPEHCYQMSLELSTNALMERDAEALKLLGVMSFLPGGALQGSLDDALGYDMQDDLKVIWGDDWRIHIEWLERFSLIQKSQFSSFIHYYTFPFISSYAEHFISGSEREIYFGRTCEQLAKTISLYSIFKSGQLCAEVISRFVLTESNFWNCLILRIQNENEQYKSGDENIPSIASILPQLLLIWSRHEEAFQAAQISIQICKLLNHKKSLAMTYGTIGNYYMHRAKYNEAIIHYEKAIHEAREIDWSIYEAEVQIAFGLANGLVGNTKLAYIEINKALQKFKKENIKSQIARCYEASAKIDGHLGRTAAALRKLEIALPLFISESDTFGTASCFAFLGLASYQSGKRDRAIFFCDGALRYHRALSLLSDTALDLRIQSYALYESGEFKGAFGAIYQAVSIFETIDHVLLEDSIKLMHKCAMDISNRFAKDTPERLKTRAEEIRSEAVMRSFSKLRNDPKVAEIFKLLKSKRNI